MSNEEFMPIRPYWVVDNEKKAGHAGKPTRTSSPPRGGTTQRTAPRCTTPGCRCRTPAKNASHGRSEAEFMPLPRPYFFEKTNRETSLATNASEGPVMIVHARGGVLGVS